MYTIQVFNKIAKSGLSQFPDELYAVSSDAKNPDAVILRSQNLHDWSIPESVCAIGRAGAGVNNIPVSAMTKLGIPVFNTPGANANAVCELVLAGMLVASRNLCTAWDYARHLTGTDAAINAQMEEQKKQFIGTELRGKTLGIIGLGSIGVRVANAAIHLGMQVIGYDPEISVSRAWELSSHVIKANHLQELLAASDYVSVHVPLVEATKHLLNAKNLAHLKPDSVLLNFAREAIVDNDAILASLTDSKMRAYVCDFPASILNGHAGVISFPHLGASTMEAEENCAVMLARQIRDYLEYGIIRHSVNFPTVEAPQHYTGERLSVVNANVPSMVAQISAKVAEAGLNIMSLINQSRDEIAYTLLDLQGEISDKILQNIASIEGVLQVRYIQRRKH